MKPRSLPPALLGLAVGVCGLAWAQPTPTPTPLPSEGLRLPAAPVLTQGSEQPEPFSFQTEAPGIVTSPFHDENRAEFLPSPSENSSVLAARESEPETVQPAFSSDPLPTPETSRQETTPSALTPIASSTDEARYTINTAPAPASAALSTLVQTPATSKALNFFSANTPRTEQAALSSRQILSPNTRGKIGGLLINEPLTLQAGGIYYFDFLDTQSPQRTDRITAGRVTIAATADNPFVIHLGTYNQAGLNTALSDVRFNPAFSYRWDILNATSIEGFSPDLFAIDDSDFVNDKNGGFFSIDQVGNRLVLDFTPVPEPSTWALLGVGTLMAVLLRFRGRRT